MSFNEIFEPGLRHWREFKELQEDKILLVPAPGPGPMDVDLDAMMITIRDDSDVEKEE